MIYLLSFICTHSLHGLSRNHINIFIEFKVIVGSTDLKENSNSTETAGAMYDNGVGLLQYKSHGEVLTDF